MYLMLVIDSEYFAHRRRRPRLLPLPLPPPLLLPSLPLGSSPRH